jgi:trigger factor
LNYKIKGKKKLDLNKIKLDVEISNSYLKKHIGKAYKNVSEKANIPGFRKGKIPYQVIDANFGRQYVLNEAASLSISELYPDIITESNLDPIDYPRIKVTHLEEDSPLGFELELELEPEVELPRYKGIKVTGYSTEVSEEELERQIDNIRNSYASLEPVEAGKTVAKGDYVTIDFNGEIEGSPFEGGNAEDYLLEVGSNTLFSELEDALIGMKKGESKKANLTLPEDTQDNKLAGRKADFNILVKEVKRKILPELNEEFLRELGDYESLDGFKNSIKEKLTGQKINFRREKIVGEILNYLMDNMKAVVPEVMVTRRIKQINEEIDRSLKEQDISRDVYLKAINITEGMLNKEIKERASIEIKEYFIFKALERVEKKNIEPSEDEINKEKDNIIKSYGKEEDIDRIKKFLESDEGKDTIAGTLRRRKIIDLLVNNAQIVENKDKGMENKRKIWAPGKSKEQDETKNEKIWTPDSK